MPANKPLTHYIVGSGSHGCLYDDGPYAHATYQDAVDDLVETFSLGRARKARLFANRSLELKPGDGAQYCEITECKCLKPWEHNEDDNPANWPEYQQKPVLKTYHDVYQDAFLRGYFECALWSSLDDSEPNGGNPMDDNYDVCDIANDSLTRMIAECEEFRTANAELLQRYYSSGRNEEQAGHDFWLTRNGHGAGFWDRGLPGNLGKELTDAAHGCGSSDLYIGDDGKVHEQ